MKEFKFKLSKKQMELFKSHGTVIHDAIPNGDVYYFLPFWIKKSKGDKKNTYSLHKLGNLPENLMDLIKSFRE